eukprot:TRINITY_DN3321_c0_g1_i4.p2 TRINITY_DN3321_c0_g1~~TRINITY_DN3321_c0_g1_i4.p2  ORF type:complete len:128 (+),score=16.26 TRINITY_DN3321_c0_g1_i4:722-1105(+)
MSHLIHKRNEIRNQPYVVNWVKEFEPKKNTMLRRDLVSKTLPTDNGNVSNRIQISCPLKINANLSLPIYKSAISQALINLHGIQFKDEIEGLVESTVKVWFGKDYVGQLRETAPLKGTVELEESDSK